MSLAVLMKHLELYPGHPELRFDLYGDFVHYSDGEREPLPDELIRTVDLLALHGMTPETGPNAEPLTRAHLEAVRSKDRIAANEAALFEDDVAEVVLDDGEFSEVFLNLRVHLGEANGSTDKDALKEFDVLARCGATFYAIEAKTNPWDVVRNFGHHLTSAHRCLGSQARVYWCVQDRMYRRGQSVAARQAEEIDWLSRNSMQYRAASFTLDSLRDDLVKEREQRRAYRQREPLAVTSFSIAIPGSNLGLLREAAPARTVLVCPLGGSPLVVANAVSLIDPKDARLVLLATDRSLDVAHDLQVEWQGQLEVVVVEINPFDPIATEEVLELCRAQAGELILDVTGGTKIVSARMASWARKHGVPARLQDIRTGRVEDLGVPTYHASVPAESARSLRSYDSVSGYEAVRRASQAMCVDRETLRAAMADISAVWEGDVRWFVDERSDPENPGHDEWQRGRAHPQPPLVALNGQAALGVVALNPASWGKGTGGWLGVGVNISPGLVVESAAASMALLRGDLGHLLVLSPRSIYKVGKAVKRMERVPASQAKIHIQEFAGADRSRAAVRDFLRRIITPGARATGQVK